MYDELLFNRAIFNWLLCLVGIRLGLWFALSFSPKPTAHSTLKEALAIPASRKLKLAVITAAAAVACYFTDASKGIAAPFDAIPDDFLLPAGFLYDLALVVMGIVIVVEVVDLHHYKQFSVEKSRRWFYPYIAIRTLTWLLLVALLTVDHHFRFLSEHLDASKVISDDPLCMQYLYMNPGFLPLLAFATLAHLVHNHHKTLMAEQIVKKKIQTTGTVIIAYITVSLIALEVLSVTAALVGLAFAAFDKWNVMRSLRKDMT